MHVHEFCGGWMDHPFWRSRFTLRSPDDLRIIVDGSIKELWIDTARGIDVLPEAAHPIVMSPAQKTAPEIRATAIEKPIADDIGEAALSGAAALCRRSLPQIATLFSDAQLGRVDAAACETLVDEIACAVSSNPGALISVTRLKRRDQYTYMHSMAVCTLMVALGLQLGLHGDALKQAGLAGMLHDLGKALIPLEVLNKPGELSAAEFELIKTHPERGYDLLREGGDVGLAVFDVCLHHHEKMDGSGYPDGLAGEEISLFARMAAVCDVYDALTSTRPYKNRWNPAEALRCMAKWKGHFDFAVLQAFVKTVGIYPVGSLVRMQSGRLGVVTRQNSQSMLSPRVKVFFSIKSDMRIEPQTIDLASDQCKDRIVGCESFDDWPFKDLDELWGAPRSLTDS